jgi:hypothetical protein
MLFVFILDFRNRLNQTGAKVKKKAAEIRPSERRPIAKIYPKSAIRRYELMVGTLAEAKRLVTSVVTISCYFRRCFVFSLMTVIRTVNLGLTPFLI